MYFLPFVEEACQTLKGWLAELQDLGHKKLETTLKPYARPDEETRAKLIGELGERVNTAGGVDMDALVKRLFTLDPAKAAKLFTELARR